MKLLVYSDLHNEFAVFEGPKIDLGDVDGVVLCGDTDLGTKGAAWALRTFKKIPVLYVAGNHEYYGSNIRLVNEALEEFDRNNQGFYFLKNREVILNGVRFLGCTLWTDFMLYGIERHHEAKRCAKKRMADFEVINIETDDGFRRLHPDDTIRFHKESIQFLTERLSMPYKGKTVVLSHHAPARSLIPEKHLNSILNPAFVNSLEKLILRYEPDLWIYGHTHENGEYVLGDTRLVSNQRGYFPMELADGFREYMVVEV